MGKKIFVSYKFADDDVQTLPELDILPTTVRDYVTKLESIIDGSDHIYKGESDDEDLSKLTEDTIWEKLKGRIYDSSVTIVMISPNMRVPHKSDRSQWIPWEVSFSLKETTRNDHTSHSNAILAIVLSDRSGSYEYYLSKSACGATIHKTDTLFKIIKENKFNHLRPDKRYCALCNSYHYYGSYSYIEAVMWCDFILSPDTYISAAVTRQENIKEYDIHKEVEA